MPDVNGQAIGGSLINAACGDLPRKQIAQARAILARWVEDYNTKRPRSSLGYATPGAFAVELEKQRAGSNPPVAPPALPRDSNGRSLVAAG